MGFLRIRPCQAHVITMSMSIITLIDDVACLFDNRISCTCLKKRRLVAYDNLSAFDFQWMSLLIRFVRANGCILYILYILYVLYIPLEVGVFRTLAQNGTQQQQRQQCKYIYIYMYVCMYVCIYVCI